MSALDGRIRSLAREEATALLAAGGDVTPAFSEGIPLDEGNSRVIALEKKVEDLTARLDALEKTTSPGAVAKRAARKPVGSGE